MKIFPGLMSRWVMPCEWAAARPLGDLDGDLERSPNGERPRCHPPIEIGPVEELGHQIGTILIHPDVVDREDVRMVETTGGPGLSLKSSETTLLVFEVIREDLDGDLATDTRIARSIHLTHPAGADDAEDLIPTERLPDEPRHIVDPLWLEAWYSIFSQL